MGRQQQCCFSALGCRFPTSSPYIGAERREPVSEALSAGSGDEQEEVVALDRSGAGSCVEPWGNGPLEGPTTEGAQLCRGVLLGAFAWRMCFRRSSLPKFFVCGPVICVRSTRELRVQVSVRQ